jgi:hypothetical protein
MMPTDAHGTGRWPRSVASLALAAWCTACGGPAGSANTTIHPEYNREDGRLERLRHDANANGVAESVSYLDGSRIVRIEVDLDENGRTDRWEYYGANQRLEKVGFSRAADGHENAWSYADATGAIIRIDIAGEPGGRVTRTEHFDRGVLTRAEEDTDGNGAPDKWETYEQGRLARLAFGAGQGEPARTLIYATDGSVTMEGRSDATPAIQTRVR